jgi:hypothetical protein
MSEKEADDCPHGFLSRVGCDKCETEDGADEVDTIRASLSQAERQIAQLRGLVKRFYSQTYLTPAGEDWTLKADADAALATKVAVEKDGFSCRGHIDVKGLIDVRDIFARIHDDRVGRLGGGLSPMELAAIRDCIQRINLMLVRQHRNTKDE